jgi:phosphoserine phosphatase
MKILSPSYKDFEKLGQAYCLNIVDGVDKVISHFHSHGVEVWILTGNFEPAVKMVADRLGINHNRIIANKVFFGPSGKYVGFDSDNPLAKNGGKAKMIQKIIQNKKRKIVYVGDGATDLDVKDHVSLFVGFGGVVEREIVKKNSDVYISEPNLEKIIDLLYLKN